MAKRCCSTLQLPMPLLVDDMHDRVGHTYSGMPDRLYLIDRDGRIAYKSGRGPFGFKTRELEQALIMLLLDQGTPPALAAAKPAAGTTASSKTPKQPPAHSETTKTVKKDDAAGRR